MEPEYLKRVRIVLVDTSHPGNIGSAARAMKTMGINKLYLVKPDEFPSAKATALASGADDLLEHATVCESVQEAVGDCRIVMGTSARLRSIPLPYCDVRQAAIEMQQSDADDEIAILFGRERYGLTNEQMDFCQKLIHVPTSKAYASLNLAQTVQLMTYELRMAGLMREFGHSLKMEEEKPATVEHFEGMLEHQEKMLEEIGFIVPAQHTKMLQRIRRVFQRARPSETEINIFRGIYSRMQEKLKDREIK
ncbi:MAG: RNA methyltransferase [bacterium]